MAAWPRSCRITSRSDYQRCYQQGEKRHTRHFILFARFVPQAPRRFGIAVSRKVGCAVVRNRVKRVLREVFRQHGGELAGLELVAVAKKEAAGINFAQARLELGPVLNQFAARASIPDL